MYVILISVQVTVILLKKKKIHVLLKFWIAIEIIFGIYKSNVSTNCHCVNSQKFFPHRNTQKTLINSYILTKQRWQSASEPWEQRAVNTHRIHIEYYQCTQSVERKVFVKHLQTWLLDIEIIYYFHKNSQPVEFDIHVHYIPLFIQSCI